MPDFNLVYIRQINRPLSAGFGDFAISQ